MDQGSQDCDTWTEAWPTFENCGPCCIAYTSCLTMWRVEAESADEPAPASWVSWDSIITGLSAGNAGEDDVNYLDVGSEFLAATKFRYRCLEVINREAWRWPRHKLNKHRIGLMDTLNAEVLIHTRDLHRLAVLWSERDLREGYSHCSYLTSPASHGSSQ
jgi:hypothetical protein